MSGRTARASGSRRTRPIRSRATHDEPGLRAAEQLVAAERHEVRARRQAFRGRRLVRQPERRRVEQRAAAEVVDDDRPVLVGDPRELARVGHLGESALAEVRGMDAQDDACALRERLHEVRGTRPVRRPDLDEPGTGAADDLRDPDAAADLHELAARDDHASAAPGRGPTLSATAAALLLVTIASAAPVSAMSASSAAR